MYLNTMSDVARVTTHINAFEKHVLSTNITLTSIYLSSSRSISSSGRRSHAAVVPTVYVISFSHIWLGFPLLLSPPIIPCIIAFSKPLWRVAWPKYLSCWRLTRLYSQSVGRWRSFNIEYYHITFKIFRWQYETKVWMTWTLHSYSPWKCKYK